ncbi:MAG: restriction endonuclease subunit S [Phycisphaerae bacterium]
MLDVAATIHYGAYYAREGLADVRFIWWLLRSNFFRGILNQHLPGGIKTELKAKRLLIVPIPLPPINEQHRIVTRIELLAEKINATSKFIRDAVAEINALENAFLRTLLRTFTTNGLLGDWLTHPPRNGWSPRCTDVEGGDADKK